METGGTPSHGCASFDAGSGALPPASGITLAAVI
jgi:hypothetical protein